MLALKIIFIYYYLDKSLLQGNILIYKYKIYFLSSSINLYPFLSFLFV